MRIVVLGAGIAGVTTAFQLLKDGHEVVIVDSADAPASFTSFANAGLMAPGHAYAWSSPKAPGMMLRSLWRGDQAIRFRPSLSPRQWSWVLAFLGQCTAERATINTRAKSALCVYSQQVFHDVVRETGVAYDGRRGGLVYFYRTPASFTAAAAKCGILRQAGIAITVLERDAVAEREPALAGALSEIAGALVAEDDESGDANLFTRNLAEACARAGAVLRYRTHVNGFRLSGDVVRAATTRDGEITGDAFVLATGVMSPALVAPLGIRLPIYPVKGYSATLRITDPDRAPRFGGVDEDNLLAYCPMGERLRLTATAEIAGYDTSHRPKDFVQMLTKARRLFGHAADFDHPTYWAGLRPMTPTGMPIVDRSPIDNLWLNCGHGHMGWTMAHGCARILADLIGQRRPAIDTEAMRHDAG
ncbi:MAG: FAD-dependent oxidoreductase [Rhizobiales bacterium]|nr:FAD-dependent oxidoreductase [Hyphomicrobiales bacterium]